MEASCWRRGVRLPSPSRQPKLALAVALLLRRLWLGSQPETFLEAEAHAAGISPRTLKSAKVLLGVETKRHGWGRGSRCWWQLGPPIGCKLGRADEARYRSFFDHLRPHEGLPNPLRSVGIPAGAQGEFVWVGLKGAKAHLRKVRREAQARGEPVLSKAPGPPGEPDWWQELRTRPQGGRDLVPLA